MDSEEQFNKEEFANLLDRAKGERSINNFASETGVSAAHISRFLRQMIASPPTPETISKFAAKARNEVTYQDLMVAAGHLIRKDDSDGKRESVIDRDSPRNIRNQAEVLEKKFIQVILADLYERSFKWAVEKPEGRVYRPDMILNIDHEGYNRWYLEFMPLISNHRHFSSMNYIMRYGRIAMQELSETDKFTIVVNDEEVFNRIIKRPPLSLRANLYVMLIDLEWGKILKEEMLCKFNKE
jgi:transcriptional regulator with XRE-family HTH domain